MIDGECLRELDVIISGEVSQFSAEEERYNGRYGSRFGLHKCTDGTATNLNNKINRQNQLFHQISLGL